MDESQEKLDFFEEEEEEEEEVKSKDELKVAVTDCKKEGNDWIYDIEVSSLVRSGSNI